MFVGIHVLLAQNTRTPEIAIRDDEGEQFLKSAENVLKHYSVTTTQKTIDWITFIGTASAIYGTRIVAIGARRRAEILARGAKVVRPRQFVHRQEQPMSEPLEIKPEPSIDDLN